MNDIITLCVGIAMLIIALAIKLAIPAAIIYIIYLLVKRLIRYNADCQDRYAQYRQAEQEAAELEAELEYMAKEYDWSKEP